MSPKLYVSADSGTVRLHLTVGIAAVGNFIGAVQPMHLVEMGTWMSFLSQPNGSNTRVGRRCG